MPPIQRLYQSPANSGGNDGALPTVYDPSWQSYTNLTPAQVEAFQGFPQAIQDYSSYSRWIKEISDLTLPNGIKLAMDSESQRKIAGLKQAFDSGALTGTVPFVAKDGVHQLAAADVTALFQACVARVQATYAAHANVINGTNANPRTITSRAQVDAAFAAIS